MKYVHICFVAHNTPQLRTDYNFFDIGSDKQYFNYDENIHALNYVCDTCYLPTNRLLLKMIEQHKNKFKFSFVISSSLIEQLKEHRVDVFESFQELLATNAVEILCSSGYHSLAALLSESEFKKQILHHKKVIKEEFNQTPKVFVNTDLIYNNQIANLIADMKFSGIFAEGAKSILGWRSPNFVYQPQHHHTMKLLFRNFELSDIVAFRFSDSTWSEYPYTANKFAHTINNVLLNSSVLNLVWDYETFGFYQKQETGILSFLYHLPQEILENSSMCFENASAILKKEHPVSKIDVEYPISWSGDAKDLSTWMGNSLQNSSLEYLYKLEKIVKKDERSIKIWRELQNSDYLSYMDTRWKDPNFVAHTQNPFQSPEQAYVVYNNILNDFASKLG